MRPKFDSTQHAKSASASVLGPSRARCPVGWAAAAEDAFAAATATDERSSFEPRWINRYLLIISITSLHDCLNSVD